MSDTSFGFGAARKKRSGKSKEPSPKESSPSERRLNLGDLKGRRPLAPEDAETIAKVDQVAERVGFPSREATPAQESDQPLRRRTRKSRPKAQLNIQGPKEVLSDFIQYCEENDISYWEAIEQMLAKNRQTPKL